MVKRQRFNSGVKPLTEDLNGIGENVEDGISSVFGPFGADTGKLLFDATAPTVVTVSGTTVDVTTPSQWVSIDGHVLKSTDYVESFDHQGADMWFRIFFVARRVPIQATRSFITTNPVNNEAIVQNLVATVQDLPELDVVYLYTDDLGADPGVPLVGPNDIGYVELAEIIIDTGVATVTVTTDNKFSLPASTQVSTSPHAAQHLPDGADPIALAAFTSTSVESSAGLMPEGALALCFNAITSIAAKPDSSFIVNSNTGVSTIESGVLLSKSHEIGLRLAPSLETALVNNEPSLSVKFFPKNVTNGISDNAARADHIHSVLDTGYLYDRVELEVSSGLAGQIVDVALNEIPNITRDRIIQVNLFWQPANMVAGFTKNKVQTGFLLNGPRTYGARCIITGANTFSVELGTDGFTLLHPATVMQVATWTSPSYSGSSAPLEGKIICEVIAIRQGAL